MRSVEAAVRYTDAEFEAVEFAAYIVYAVQRW